MQEIPNLFRARVGREAAGLYELYLSLLMGKSRWKRVVGACRHIRTCARRAGQRRSGDFTYHYEIEALCNLGSFPTAWGQLRRFERIAYKKPINLRGKVWRPDELEWFTQYHPQILYFLGRYKLASRLYEAVLQEMLTQRRKGSSNDLLPYIYNGVAHPRRRQEVTLYHLYLKQGRSLVRWVGWDKFVRGFQPKLFKVTGVRIEDLLLRPSLLLTFFRHIQSEEREKESHYVPGVCADRAPASVQHVVSRDKLLELEGLFPELRGFRSEN